MTSSFERQVQEALDRIPPGLQEGIRNVAVVVKERPGEEAREAFPDGDWEDLYGFYQGVPLPERSADDSGLVPDVIYIYQHPLEEDFPDKEDLIREIEITVVHELAHYFGFDEAQLEHYGYD
ncbi:MAG TPA: metallopeptidase family protein [Nitrospiria bacterium]